MITWTFGPFPLLIAGPCVVEPPAVMDLVAAQLVALAERLTIPVCFKASFDKANRASAAGARGPGLEEGLRSLERVRREFGLPVLTDVHEVAQVTAAAEVVDVIQIPAFLSRQTDLLLAAGASGKPVNVKKGQWMAASGMAGAVEKLRTAGATEVAVTERGTFFGYGDLVVDMRNLARMRAATAGAAVLFDATHSVQQPGTAPGGASGGDRGAIPGLLMAAAAAGADGFFIETHPDPGTALSDRSTQWPLDQLEGLVSGALAVWQASRGTGR